MKSKRKKVEKYNVGGYLQAGLAGAQTLYGLASLPAARAEFQRAQAAAPSLETPAQFYQNYKNAYDAELANLENEAIQANLATSVQALQGAGGRALVGGLPAATAGAARQRQQMLQQERALRMRAGEQLARAEEATIGRKEARSQREIAMANQGYQAALGNIGAGLGSMGTGLMYGMMGGDEPTTRLDDVINMGDFIDNQQVNVPRKDSKPSGATYTPPVLQMPVSAEKIGETKNTMMQDAFLEEWYEKQKNKPVFNFIDESERYIQEQEKLAASIAQKREQAQVGKSNIETVSSKAANTLYSKMQDSIERSMPRDQFKNWMLGENQFVQFYDDIAVIRNMDATQIWERNTARKMGQINDNVLTKSSFQRVVPFGNKQHGGMITDGEFNHKTNPIDIVQNGVKVGEATGNEVILNPTQAKKIANQSSYARKLFKSFERKAKRGK